MMTRFRDRPTGDILVIIIASTICSVVLFTSLSTTIFAFVNPGADVDAPARLIADVTNTLIGLLAGFLAGTTTSRIGIRGSKAVPKDPSIEQENGNTPLDKS